jgi:DNA-directed RNA polymerase specialized sigma subunit
MGNYADNGRMLELLRQSHEKGAAVLELIETVGNIASQIIRRHRTCMSKDEAYSLGCWVAIDRYTKFDMERKNPFAWFTTVIMNEMKQNYKKEESQVKLKIKMSERLLSSNPEEEFVKKLQWNLDRRKNE